MKRIAVVLLLLLANCATYNNPINTSELATAESTYGVALSIAVAYHNSCAQKLIPKTCRAIVAKLQAADRKAQVLLVRARTFVKDNPTVSAITIIAAARDAVDAFTQLELQYGVAQ